MFNKVGGLFLLLALFFFIFLFPIRIDLELSTKGGEILETINLKGRDSFEISFRHSVNRGIVREKYQINHLEDSFYLKTAWFESYGAGMLDELPNEVTMMEDGDFLRLEFPQENMTSVCYAAAGFAKHKIKLGDTVIDLFELNPYKTTVIKVKRLTIIDILIN